MLSLAEADPGAVDGQLALARCLEASYQDASGQADEPAMLKQLAKAYHAFGLDTPEGRDRARAGGDR